jgi:TPR repeat protein
MTLGMMYEQGLGVEKNETEAKKWYGRATAEK